MRVLVVTSSLAYDIAKEVVGRIKDHEVVVYRLDYPIASLMTTTYISKELSGKVDSSYDYILIPGLALGDASVIKNVVKCEVFKGPKYLGDLPEVIKLLESGVKLSTTKPADEVLKEYLSRNYESELRKLLNERNYVFHIKSLGVPLRPPPIVLAYEVMLRSVDDYRNTLSKIERACKLDIDLVIIGSPVIHEVPIKVFNDLISTVRDVLGKPVGVDLPVDTVGKLSAEFDLIMNVSGEGIKSLSSYSDKALVIVPNDASNANSCIASLISSIQLARSMSFSKLIIDPILRPPQLGLTKSLMSYYKLSRELEYPLMMGLSNVYELMDSDTHSVIALLTSIAMELGVSTLLVTEESAKSYNAVAEAVRAREMVYRAYLRKSPPIDVGIDLLVVKEKRRRGIKPLSNCVRSIYVGKDELPPRITDEYYFRIYVDHDNNYLVVDVINNRSGECVVRYLGIDALSICRKVLSDFGDLISRDHYMYLSYELCKAEIALKLRRSYVQDEPLFGLDF